MLKLYYAPGTCALASHIALVHSGAQYVAERVDFGSNQQRSPGYLGINPKGRVPALVTEHGVLTETPAILAYIAQRFPASRLAPLDDPFAFARAQEFCSYLCSTVHVMHAHRSRGVRWADRPESLADMKSKVAGNMTDCVALIEHDMPAGPWVMGAAYTICDPYLHTIARWLEGDGVDVARFPKVADHTRRMAERADVRRALAEQKG